MNLGTGRRINTMRVNKKILNRKLENFSLFFLTMGGGEDKCGLRLNMYVLVN